jgi:hypothetical protein
MAIERIKIRARIIGGGLNAQTPYVQSFNVKKTRGQPSTFNCSVKMLAHSVGAIRGQVEIYAGEGRSPGLIFTGVITKATISPCWDDPMYVIINASGTDVMKNLEYKKYTRRQRSTNACWCEITGVTRKHLKSQKFKYLRTADLLKLTDGDMNQKPEVTQTTQATDIMSSLGKDTQRGVPDSGVPLIYTVEAS